MRPHEGQQRKNGVVTEPTRCVNLPGAKMEVAVQRASKLPWERGWVSLGRLQPAWVDLALRLPGETQKVHPQNALLYGWPWLEAQICQAWGCLPSSGVRGDFEQLP